MEAVLEKIRSVFDICIGYATLAVECIGASVILFAAIRAVVQLIRRREGARSQLAHSIALALEFMMAGELLRTTAVEQWNELLGLAVVILLRTALALLFLWEGRNEKKKSAAGRGTARDGGQTDTPAEEPTRPMALSASGEDRQNLL